MTNREMIVATIASLLYHADVMQNKNTGEFIHYIHRADRLLLETRTYLASVQDARAPSASGSTHSPEGAYAVQGQGHGRLQAKE